MYVIVRLLGQHKMTLCFSFSKCGEKGKSFFECPQLNKILASTVVHSLVNVKMSAKKRKSEDGRNLQILVKVRGHQEEQNDDINLSRDQYYYYFDTEYFIPLPANSNLIDYQHDMELLLVYESDQEHQSNLMISQSNRLLNQFILTI